MLQSTVVRLGAGAGEQRLRIITELVLNAAALMYYYKCIREPSGPQVSTQSFLVGPAECLSRKYFTNVFSKSQIYGSKDI